MIITDDFVFLNYPKTGSTFVRKVLNEIHCPKKKSLLTFIYPQKRLNNYKIHKTPNLRAHFNKNRWQKPNEHGLRCQIPYRDQKKTIFSVKRNFFEIFVSSYEYGDWKINHFYNLDKIRSRYPKFPNLNFEEFIRFKYNFPPFVEHPYITNYPHQLGVISINFILFFAKKPFDTINKWDFDKKKNFLNELDEVHFLENSVLNNNLYGMLKSYDYPEKSITHIISQKKANVSKPEGKGYKDYYNNEISDLVMEKESILFDYFSEYKI